MGEAGARLVVMRDTGYRAGLNISFKYRFVQLVGTISDVYQEQSFFKDRHIMGL